MKKSRRKRSELLNLTTAIAETGRQIAETNQCFNQATDELLIDACIYKLKYLRIKYAYLVHLARLEAESEQIPAEASAAVCDPGFTPIRT